MASDNYMTGDTSKIVQDDDEVLVPGNPFTIKRGEVVYIDASDPCDVRVYSSDGQEIGSFKFSEIECPSGPYETEIGLHLCYMEVAAAYRRQGIGRECIRRAKEQSGADIVSASSEHARNLEDGSHLIGQGPMFVRAMAEEGILSQDGYEGPDPDYE